jgi:hypothetical protein
MLRLGSINVVFFVTQKIMTNHNNSHKRGNNTIIGVIIVALVILIGGIAIFLSTNTTSDSVIDVGTNNPATSTPDSSSSGTVSQVKVYYVALEDAGQSGPMIGCNDSVVAVTTDITPTQAPLHSALEKLFADKRRDIGESGFINALYQSDIKVDSATVVDGVATVKLSGTTQLGGVCDDPRAVNQIKYTVLQFPSITSANITLNNKPLDTYFSQKGE